MKTGGIYRMRFEVTDDLLESVNRFEIIKIEENGIQVKWKGQDEPFFINKKDFKFIEEVK
jgi:hypothetical protein